MKWINGMQTGELTESVRKRSVERHLNITRESGQCVESLSDLVISTAGPLPGYLDMPWRQVTAAANSLAANHADGSLLCLQGLLPESMEEAALQADMRQFEAEAEANAMQFLKADLQVSNHVTAPQYSVTAIGVKQAGPGTASAVSDMPLWLGRDSADKAVKPQAGWEHMPERPKGVPERVAALSTWEDGIFLRPGQELLIVRPIALAGTAALARLYEKELRGRFPHWLIDRAKGFDRWMSVTEAARAVCHFGACPMYCIAQGGIFNALWEMAEPAGVGLEVDLRKIPVQQETIEICEYFAVNPYYLYSAGALLVGTEHAEALLARLREAGIWACVIGHVTDNNDRVIWNGENRRYLDRPKQDELWRITCE